MSRTIVTNSGTEFYTNINTEQLIGTLCREVGAKFCEYGQSKYMVHMAYSMTEEEALDAANKLKYFIGKGEYVLKKYSYFYSKDFDVNLFDQHITEIINDIEKSKGYNCLE